LNQFESEQIVLKNSYRSNNYNSNNLSSNIYFEHDNIVKL